MIGGDYGVGKTTFRKKYFTKLTDKFNGVAYLKQYNVNGKAIKFLIKQIITTPNNMILIKPHNYVGMSGTILLFDVTRPDTFYNIERWINVILNSTNRAGPFPFVIIGNKIDLRETGDYSDFISDDVAIEHFNILKEKYTNTIFSVKYFSFSTKLNTELDFILDYFGKEIIDSVRDPNHYLHKTFSKHDWF